MAIENDATIETTFGGTDAEDLFFNHLTAGDKSLSEDGGDPEETPKNKKKPAPPTEETEEDKSGESPDEDTEDTEEDEAKETEEDSDHEDDKAKRKPNVIEDENTIVKVKQGDKEHEVSIKDLKRLYGQEAALTQKSQEVAAVRKQAEDNTTKAVTALDTMLKKAQERYKPYAEINYAALYKDPNISAEEITALQTEAAKAKADVDFFGQELDSTLKGAREQQAAQSRQAAQEAHKILSDPKTGIEGWSQPLYDDIRNYAVSSGIPADVINSVTDATQIKLLHKAMLYDKGQKAAAKTAKVVSTPNKVVKSPSVDAGKITKGKPADAMARLRRSGSTEDAEAAFLARMGSDD